MTFKSVQSNRCSAYDALSPNSSTGGLLKRAIAATEPETRPVLAAQSAVPMGPPTLPLSVASCSVLTSTQGGKKRGKECVFLCRILGTYFIPLPNTEHVQTVMPKQGLQTI